MRAVVHSGHGGPETLAIREVDDPAVPSGHIRVRVRATALNRADILQRRGGYPAPAGAPADIAGLEYAGEVDAVGPGATLWKPGARVMGIVAGGGHAEHVCVHEREALPVPDDMPWEDASAIPEAFLTAYDALFRQMRLGIGDRLLIHAAASGVGTAAIQLAALAGATVIGTSRSGGKLERAAALGLHLAIDSSAGGWAERVEEATGGKGVTAVLDLVGGSYFAESLRVMAPRATLVLVGLTAGSRAEVSLDVVLRKRLTIVGTVLRSRPLEEKIALARDFSTAVLPALAERRVRPVVGRVFSFREIREAHAFMESDESFGKLVLRWDEESGG